MWPNLTNISFIICLFYVLFLKEIFATYNINTFFCFLSRGFKSVLLGESYKPLFVIPQIFYAGLSRNELYVESHQIIFKNYAEEANHVLVT